MDTLTLWESGEGYAGVPAATSIGPAGVPAKTPEVAFPTLEGRAGTRNLRSITSGSWSWAPLRVWDPAAIYHRIFCMGKGIWWPSPLLPLCWEPRHLAAFLGGPSLADPDPQPGRLDPEGNAPRYPPLLRGGGYSAYSLKGGWRDYYTPPPFGIPRWRSLDGGDFTSFARPCLMVWRWQRREGESRVSPPVRPVWWVRGGLMGRAAMATIADLRMHSPLNVIS